MMMNRMPIKKMVLCALFAALTAVCAQISIPLGAVPVTLQLLPIVLCAALMTPKYATLSNAVYLLMGLVGLPVFAGLGGGAGKLFGVTGGYLIGFLPCAFLTSLIIVKWGKEWYKMAAAMVIGVAVCYAFGTAWFMATKGLGLMATLGICVIPFIPGDCLKIALAVVLAKRLEKPMKKILAE